MNITSRSNRRLPYACQEVLCALYWECEDDGLPFASLYLSDRLQMPVTTVARALLVLKKHGYIHWVGEVVCLTNKAWLQIISQWDDIKIWLATDSDYLRRNLRRFQTHGMMIAPEPYVSRIDASEPVNRNWRALPQGVRAGSPWSRETSITWLKRRWAQLQKWDQWAHGVQQ
jgi:hypothetical protein